MALFTRSASAKSAPKGSHAKHQTIPLTALGEVHAGVLRSKKKHRLAFLAAKWQEHFYVISDSEGALLQYKSVTSRRNAEPALVFVPFVDIESVSQVEHKSSRHTGFEITMRETSSVLPPASVWLFEAPSAEECTLWIREIRHRTRFNNIVLAKEDHLNDYRTVYEPVRTRDAILGTGMTGTVKRVKRISDNKILAMKTIRLAHITPTQRQSLQNEIDILKSMDHPHIAKLYEVFVEPGHCVRMILELCEGGELFDRLHARRRFNEHYTASLMGKMLSVLNYLHRNNVVHRDLKLENWLFRHKDVDDTDIVLIDFGLSKRHRAGEHMHRTVGTSYYVAPEVLYGDYTGEACDLWSLGVIAFMLLGGSAPFDGADDDEIIESVKSNQEPKMDNRAWANISDHGKTFVSALLKRDPEVRPTAAQALSHPWITMDEESRPKHMIESTTFENLRRFTACKKLKQIALEAVAFNLNHDEIHELTLMFEDMDTDHDGYVSFPELKQALSARNDTTEVEARAIFDALDTENKGSIHVTEFVAAALEDKFVQDEHNLREAFHALDEDGTGFITTNSLHRVLGSSVHTESVNQMVGEVDPSLKVSYQQFLTFMKEDTSMAIKNVLSQANPIFNQGGRQSMTDESGDAEAAKHVHLSSGEKLVSNLKHGAALARSVLVSGWPSSSRLGDDAKSAMYNKSKSDGDMEMGKESGDMSL